MGWTLRGALSADVNAGSPSFLGREIAGRPGPVWSMVAWYAVIASFLALGAASSALLPNQVGRQSLTAYVFAFCLSSAIALWWFGARVPGWLLHLLVDVNIAIICLVSASRASELTAAIPLAILIFAALYAATWFRRRELTAHLVLLTVLSAAAVLTRGGDPELRVLWATIVMLCWGLGFFVNTLVRDLNRQVLSDPLTGVLNRTGLEIVAASRSGDRLEALPRSVAVLDLDAFKEVNDREGHQAGDALLREVGAVMRAQLRPADTVARTGGDEFVILLPFTPADQADAVIARVVASLPIGCSYGIVDWPAGVTFEEAVKGADGEMYAHKQRNVI